MNFAYIRSSSLAQLGAYYKDLWNDQNGEIITKELLEAVRRGSVAPTAFAPWLALSKSPDVIQSALKQKFSVQIRGYAIKQLYKALSCSSWKQNWNSLGGTHGLLDIFSDLSVLEVRQACRLIGRCGWGDGLEEKRIKVTELFEGLHPDVFPDAKYKTKDQRPLAKFYQHLIPSCTESIVDMYLDGEFHGNWPSLRKKKLLRYHPTVMRREQLRALDINSSVKVDTEKLGGLVNHWPSTVGNEAGLSASMEFSLIVLRKLVESGSPNLDDDFFVNQLARPLIRRAIRKRLSWSKVQEIFDLIMQYLEKHPYAGKEMTILEGDLPQLLAASWSRKPELFEETLLKMYSNPEYIMAGKSQLADWESFLGGVRRERRYALLRLCIKASAGRDIDDDHDLKSIKGALTNNLVENLSAKGMLNLFTRLRAVRGDEGLVKTWNESSILHPPSDFGGSGGDPDLWNVFLHCRVGDWDTAETLAAPYMEARKKKAASASQAEQRAFYAQCVISCATASDSLSNYGQVIDWGKRFKRDRLVCLELFPHRYPKEAIKLLSGLPEYLGNDLNLVFMKHRVTEANGILKRLFDTACEALREPSFYVHDWSGVMSLFQSVVQTRLDMSTKLRKLLKANDEEMYSILWEDTIATIIAIETKANEKRYERLGTNNLEGLLGLNRQAVLQFKAREAPNYMFMDNLAKQREELWRKLRLDSDPPRVSLPSIFPRGLPIQYLIAASHIDIHYLETYAPYVVSRAKCVLFPDPKEALDTSSSIEEAGKVFGAYVDSYDFALELYINDSLSHEKKVKRAKNVWDYATGPLSEARMTGEEALRFWTNRLPWNIRNLLRLERDSPSWPLIPEATKSGEAIKWNPISASAGRPVYAARKLSATYIDLSLAVRYVGLQKLSYPTGSGNLVQPEVPEKIESSESIWSVESEGKVLSALMYLESSHDPHTRLLSVPFPDSSNVRYPPLVLDEEFVQKQELNVFSAIRSIGSSELRVFPPDLLERFALNIWERVAALNEEDAKGLGQELLEPALRSILLLSESDKPRLATELAIHTTLERPSESAWHRLILNRNFFRRLPASDARACFEKLSNAVLARMHATRENESSDQKPPNTTFIKVTTIKLVAELLQQPEFVSEGTSLTVLSKLLSEGSHADVRLRVIKSLFGMLESCTTELAEKIISVLESIISMTGNLNERKPLTEHDWAEAENTKMPPELSLGATDPSPTLSAMLDHYRNSFENSVRQQQYVDRILLPTFESLKQQTARWTTLFLQKQGAEIDIPLPPVPRNPTYLRTVLSAKTDRVALLPRTILEEYITWVKFNIAPPDAIKQLNKNLRESPELSARPDTATWLRLYGRRSGVMTSFNVNGFLSHPEIQTRLPEDTGITPLFIREQLMSVFTALVWADAPPYSITSTHFLSPFLSGENLRKPWWKSLGKPIITEMITYINEIRTPEWEQDPQRQPAILPDTFPWQLMLCDFPIPSPDDSPETTESKCKKFADQTSVHLRAISVEMSYTKLEQIKNSLSLSPVPSTSRFRTFKTIKGKTAYYNQRDIVLDDLTRNRVLTAIHLGDISSTPLGQVSTSEILHVQMAKHLLEISGSWENAVDPGVKARVEKRVEEWRASANEEVRRVGYAVMLEKEKEVN